MRRWQGTFGFLSSLVLACGGGGAQKRDAAPDVATDVPPTTGEGGSTDAGARDGGPEGGAGGAEGGAGGAMDAGIDAAVDAFEGDAGQIASDVTASIDVTNRHQTMVGFGGNVAYYAGLVGQRNVPNDDLPDLLFRDMGLDVLRIGNWYQNQAATGTSAATPFSDFDMVALVQKATTSLGHPPKIVMSSWSPPAYLKSIGNTNGGGTLVSTGGVFAYDQLGLWWVAALTEYAARGIKPDFIAIQNEPDWASNYETCRFDPAEGINAGYPQALAAVHDRIAASDLSPKPQILGPDTIGIGYSTVQSYLAGANLDDIDVIAHHLYHGGAQGDDPPPDSFTGAMMGVAGVAAAAGKPLFMTEFQPNVPSILNTAWLIYNAVVVEGVSAYIYWPLFWAPGSGPPIPPVTVETPGAFTTPKGYTVNDIYYVLKHYARWVDSGWVRVEASATADAVKVSAFVAPDGSSLTAVLVNTDSLPHAVKVSPGTFPAASAAGYRTSGTSERCARIPLGVGNVVPMPAGSVATIAMTR